LCPMRLCCRITPRDNHLAGSLKQHMGGHWFHNVQKVKVAVCEYNSSTSKVMEF
jgi:hypothetical protein